MTSNMYTILSLLHWTLFPNFKNLKLPSTLSHITVVYINWCLKGSLMTWFFLTEVYFMSVHIKYHFCSFSHNSNLLWFLWTLILSSLLFISYSSHMLIICKAYNCAFMSLFKLLIKMLGRTDSHSNAHNTNILCFHGAKTFKKHIDIHDLIWYYYPEG